MSFVIVQVIVGGLLLGAVYALFSSGLTLVWGMMNVVNFAHGDFVMLGMYVAYLVYTLLGAGPLIGAPLAMLVLATLGVVVYFSLIRDIMKGPMLAQILGTFGLALLLRYSVFWWFGANFLTPPENLVGGTLAIVAFVTLSLGGFGSVPGALVAGLLIGVIESLSGYLIGAIYQDIVVYSLFLGFLWFRPQGLMGKA